MIVVVANGCFDVFHYGHLAHLQAARALGDRLVVSLTADAYVNKGPGRPVFNEQQRKALLLGLRCVDEVIICTNPMAVLEVLRPQIYCKGRDYEGKLSEQLRVEGMGIKVIFTDTVKFSSTALLGWL